MILQHSNSRIENMKDEFVFVIERFIFKCEFIVYDECFSIFMIQKLYTIGWTISVNNWVIEPNFAMFLRQCISFIISRREKKTNTEQTAEAPSFANIQVSFKLSDMYRMGKTERRKCMVAFCFTSAFGSRP